MNIEELRLQLVLRCLDQHKDVDRAIEAALRLEGYILGSHSEDEQQLARADISSVKSRLAELGRADAAWGASERQGDDQAKPAAETAMAAEGCRKTGVASNGPGHAGPVTPEPRAGTAETASAPAKKPGRGAGKKNRWTPEAERILCEQWESGQPTERIAAELGRTPASVRERARRLNLRRRKRYRKDEPESDHRGTMPRPPAQASRKTGGENGQVATMSSWRAASGNGTQAASRKAKFRRPRPFESKPSPVAITELQEHRVQRPEVTLTTVINFVRSRDYSVVRSEDGEVVVDGRRRFTTDEFIEWANNLRRQLRKPEFPCEVLRAS